MGRRLSRLGGVLGGVSFRSTLVLTWLGVLVSACAESAPAVTRRPPTDSAAAPGNASAGSPSPAMLAVALVVLLALAGSILAFRGRR